MPVREVNRETYHVPGGLAADVNAVARRIAERRRAPCAPNALEALELMTGRRGRDHGESSLGAVQLQALSET